MKAVILAGGLGSRISEETETRPKPMIEIGGRPILWHIMKLYAAHGIDEFVVCLGYKGYVIKEFFANYFLHSSDVTFDLARNHMEIHKQSAEPWKVTLVDTGPSTMTGGRLRRVLEYVGDGDFCFTYGDGVADVDITRLVEFHKAKGTVATVTAVQPPGRFGAIESDGEQVTGFLEKPHGDGGWINGGFFVLSPKVRDYLSGSDTQIWEREPLEDLARAGELSLYRHDGFWQPMDTRREWLQLQEMWESGEAPWRVWT
jgi:glucose-1-phosphate cytidylyltransferase